MIDTLRWIVSGLAVLTTGAALTVAAPYLVATWRNGRQAPGRILARHVVEVSVGTAGLAAGQGIASYSLLGGVELIPVTARLILFVVSLLLLLVGVLEVGAHQRRRADRAADRGEQVLAAVRVAIDRHRVIGPRSADEAARRAANAVLALEGAPPVPEPPPEQHGDDYGRHALPPDREPS